MTSFEWFLDKASGYLLRAFETQETFVASISGAFTAFATLESKTGWLYLLTSIGIAWVIYAYKKGRESGTRVPFLRFLFPREVYLHRSAIVDYKFVAIDLTIKVILYTPLIAGVSMLVYKAAGVPFAWLGTFELPFHSALVGTIAIPLIALAVADFGFFFAHYLMHKIPVLWYFHEVHHSAEVLTPITVYRTHPVEDLINAGVAAVIAGAGAAAFTSTTGTEVTLPMMFGVNVVQFAFFAFAFQLRHSHIWLSYGPVLSRIFISPAQHQIHHSQKPRHWDKNFGFMLAIWDVMFASLYVPRTREVFRLGVSNADPQDFSSVPRLYLLPFAKAARRLRADVRRRFGKPAPAELPAQATDAGRAPRRP